MSDTKAPREFWVYEGQTRFKDANGVKALGLEVYDKSYPIVNCVEFHVVEKTALDKANSEIEQRKILNTQNVERIFELEKEIERLQLQYRKRLEHSEEVRDERDRYLQMCESLAEELKKHIKMMRQNFHRDTCEKSRGCHCGPVDWTCDALDEYDKLKERGEG